MSFNRGAGRVPREQILGLLNRPRAGGQRGQAEVLLQSPRGWNDPVSVKELKQPGRTETVRLFLGHMLNLSCIKTSPLRDQAGNCFVTSTQRTGLDQE